MKKGHQLNDVLCSFNQQSTHPQNQAYSLSPNLARWMPASDWRNILSIVEKSDLGIKLIPIKKYLNSQIENALRYADWEIKRKFIEDDWV